MLRKQLVGYAKFEKRIIIPGDQFLSLNNMGYKAGVDWDARTGCGMPIGVKLEGIL